MEKILNEQREVEEIDDKNDRIDAGESSHATESLEYKASFRTWIVVMVLGLGWSTGTLANVGPATTSSYVAKSLNGAASSSWIPNAALFPLIGLQPFWASSTSLSAPMLRLILCRAPWLTIW